jgi:hypothetical protein
MGQACDRAGFAGLTFHDLRGTAFVRSAIPGAASLRRAYRQSIGLFRFLVSSNLCFCNR